MLRRALLSAGRRLAPRDLGAASPATMLAPACHATATRDYAKSARGRVRGRRGPRGAAPPPADDPWEEVRDETTGQTYWWNVQTNETTALGAPKPRLLGTSAGDANAASGAPPPVGQPMGSNAVARPGGGSMLGGFGSMVAEGMAFGTGSALAHRAIGSIFGGGDTGTEAARRRRGRRRLRRRPPPATRSAADGGTS